MALIKWNQDPFEDFDRMFNSMMLTPVRQGLRSGMEKMGMDLAVDLYEEDGNVIAEMNLPGIDPEKVDVDIEDGYLKISGSREEIEEEKDEKRNYYSREIKRGSFRRMVALPDHVDEKKAEAEYEEGVLRVKFPKLKEKKSGTKKIAIKRKKKK